MDSRESRFVFLNKNPSFATFFTVCHRTNDLGSLARVSVRPFSPDASSFNGSNAIATLDFAPLLDDDLAGTSHSWHTRAGEHVKF
jgi:hypothetical protein